MNQSRLDDTGKLILRLALGSIVLLHGIAKLTGGVDGIGGMLEGVGLPRLLAYGVLLGEVLGPLLLIIGWHARVGAALIAINMLFAVALAHLPQVLILNDQGGWAIELQALMLFSAIALLFLGPGRYSLNGR